MKWLSIAAGLVLAAIVGTVVVLPRVIDWNAYRPEIAEFAAATIGRPLIIEGNIRASLFPTPQLIAGNIRVPDAGDGPDVAAIRWAEARFKFSDLLRGDVTLTGLALVEPELTVTVGILDAVSSGSEEAAGTETSAPSLTTGTRRQARVFEIRNGTLKVERPGGDTFVAENVGGRIETPAVGRRITVAAEGRVEGRDIALDMRVAPARGTAPAPVSFTLQDRIDGGRLRVAGEWKMVDGKPSLVGEFAVDGGNFSALSSMAGLPFAAALPGSAMPLRVDGNLEYDGAAARLELSNLAVDADALSASGDASFRWETRPSVSLSMRVGRLDLDAYDAAVKGRAQPVAMPQAEAEDDGVAQDAPDLQGGVDTMGWIGALPADLSLDLSIAGARFRDTVVRRITLRGSVERGTVTLEEMSAQLPGGTDLSIAGFGDMTGTEPLLEGNATIRADDLRRLLNWAGAPMPNVAADRLRRFSMVSGISLRPRRLDIIDAAIELDGVTVSAAAAVALRRRLGLGVRLSLDHINLDAYRPPTTTAAAPATSSVAADSGGNAAAIGEVLEEAAGIEALWSRFDASLDLKIGRAVLFEIPFNDVAGSLVLKDGVLTVNELRFQDAGGISGAMGGQIAVAGDDEAVVMAFEGQSDDLGRIPALLEGPDFMSGFLRSFGPADIRASYQPLSDGPPVVLQVDGRDGALSLSAALPDAEPAVPTVEILSGDVSAYGITLTALKGRFSFPPDSYQVEKFSGTLNGGALHLSGSLQRREDGLQQLLIAGALDDMKVDRQLADLDGPIGVAGKLSIRGQSEATGSDWRAMTALNSGWLDIDGDLVLEIGRSRSSIVKVQQISEVRAVLREGFAEPSAVSGRAVLENGVLTADDLILSGKNGTRIGISGRLGLNTQDLSAEAVLRKSGEAPYAARLVAEGPANAPNLRLERAGASGN